jgi:hypothetical protein
MRKQSHGAERWEARQHDTDSWTRRPARASAATDARDRPRHGRSPSPQAAARAVSVQRLVLDLIDAIARDKLAAAVLDVDESQVGDEP